MPDVAVLDVRLPDGSGVEVCREVRDTMPQTRCLMLTSYADDEALFNAIMAGASGYVLKEIRGNDLVDAIRQVAAGRSLLDPVATQRVMERLRKGEEHDERLDALTDQERRILELIGEGLTNRQIGERMALLTPREREVLQGIFEGKLTKVIADELGIGVRTAETYRQLIMQKLEAGSIAELVRLVVDAMPKRSSAAQ